MKKLKIENINKIEEQSIDELKLFIEIVEFLRENKEVFFEKIDTKLYSIGQYICMEIDDKKYNTKNIFENYANDCFCGYQMELELIKQEKELFLQEIGGRMSFYIKFNLLDKFYNKIIGGDNSCLYDLLNTYSIKEIIESINNFITIYNFIESIKKENNFLRWWDSEKEYYKKKEV